MTSKYKQTTIVSKELLSGWNLTLLYKTILAWLSNEALAQTELRPSRAVWG